MDEARKAFLKGKSRAIRETIIRMIGKAGGGHIGGSLSIVEALVYLYHQEIRPSAPSVPPHERDRFILSKGHAGPALYAVLCDLGHFPAAWLDTLNRPGTSLPSHCNMSLTPGVDFTTGSLGQGLSAAAGMALGTRLRGGSGRVFAMIGDGEAQEGQIWEAAMFAAHHKLANLIAFADNNRQQIDGNTSDVMSVEDLVEKWRSFNWRAERIDGHDFDALERALSGVDGERPTMIVLDTIKAKGFAPGEGSPKNHYMDYDLAKAEEAIALLPLA